MLTFSLLFEMGGGGGGEGGMLAGQPSFRFALWHVARGFLCSLYICIDVQYITALLVCMCC